MRKLICILVLMLAVPASAQQVYRWVDEDGNVHYGERPPAETQAESLKIQRPPSNEEVEVAEEFAEADLDAEEEQRLALQRKHCELARENLQALTRSDYLYERDESGERRILEDEEAEQAREEARQAVEERCADLEDEN